MRLGDLDALLNEVRNNKELYERERVYLEGLLLNAPTVIWCNQTSEGLPLMDMRVKPLSERGEWVDGYCNKCGGSTLCDGWGRDVESNFCPHCGAKMKGGAE